MSEPILIVGTGALACLFAARLSAIGVSVTLLGTWPEGLRAFQRGVRLEENGEEKTFPVRATNNSSDCFGSRYALVLVKAWQTERAARQLGMCLAADGVALTLQNGYGNRETLAKSLGQNKVALGVTTTGATLIGPGRVRPGGQGTISVESHPRLEPIISLLRQAGFTVEETPNANSLVWSKLVINAAINPLTALLRVPNGELLERPPARALMADLAREAAAVAAVLNISLTFPDPVAASEDVARRTAANHSSMYQDVQRGAPTEIDAICGAVVRVGEQVGVPTPVNRVMWQLIQAKVVSNQ
jgi:2-dehydropantoate 2-reductase